MKNLNLSKHGQQYIEFKIKEPEKVTLSEVFVYEKPEQKPYYIVMIGGMPVRLFDRVAEARRKYDIEEEGYKVFANQKTVDYYIDLIGAL